MKKIFESALLTSMVVLIASSNLISQEISTVEEVYNFEVGDIFHIRGDYGWVSSPEHITKTIDSVVQKSFSSSNDTIFYTIQRHFAEKSSSNPVWTTYDTTILQSYWNLNASINNGNIDTVFNDPDWYNERTINKVEYSIGDADHTKKFVEGCGLASDYVFYDDGSLMTESNTRLVYYKKGQEEWGEPLLLTTINDSPIVANDIYVFPNPCTSHCIIDLRAHPNPINNIKVFNLAGFTELEHVVISNQLIKIETSKLEAGVYFILVVGQKETTCLKMIKQKNGS